MKTLLLILAMVGACMASALPMRAANGQLYWQQGQGSGTDSTFAPFALATTGVGPGDVTTDPLAVLYMGTRTATTSAADTVQIGDRQVRVADTTGMAPGQFLYIFDTVALSFEQFEVLSIAAPDTINVDVPCGDTYPTGSIVYTESVELNVDGSSTPVVFTAKPPDIVLPATSRYTRIIFTIETASTGAIGDFGDISGGLTNGVFLRRVDGISRTLFNLKKNIDFAQIAYDLEEFPATGPFGADGFRCRLTFAKMGGVIELAPDENLELWVQDDLSSLVRFRAVIEGTFGPPVQ